VPLGPVGVNVDVVVAVAAASVVVDVDAFFLDGVGVRGFETLYVVVIRVCVCRYI